MRPAAFELVRPRTFQEAFQHLHDGGAGTRFMAGGQALLRDLRYRAVAPPCVVDLSAMADLDYVRESGDGIEVGALTPLAAFAEHPLVLARCRAAAEAAARVGDVQVRNRGTVGGNLCGGWTAGGWSVDVGVALAASGGEVIVRDMQGERRVDAATFFAREHGPEGHGEMIVGARFGTADGSAYVRLSRRYADGSTGSCAAFVSRHGGALSLGLAFGRVHAHVVRATEGEQVVAARGADAPDFDAALARFAAGLAPPDNPHAGREYRREVLPVIGRRATKLALARAATGDRT